LGRNNTNTKDERHKRIMRLPRPDKSGFAMTEGENKRRNTKDGFPFSRE